MKYRVTINEKSYEVEVEQSNATVIGVSNAAPVQAAPVQAAPVPAPAPVPIQAEAPAPVLAPAPSGGEAVNAPMPGTILDIKVATGDSVKKGQVLLILEAMKMENEIVAPRDGKVSHISVSSGASVNVGTLLLKLE